MDTRLSDTMLCPVVPAGMLAVATTTGVFTGATVVVPDWCVEPVTTVANAMAPPATNRTTPITTSTHVCLFTTRHPLHTGKRQRCGAPTCPSLRCHGPQSLHLPTRAHPG